MPHKKKILAVVLAVAGYSVIPASVDEQTRNSWAAACKVSVNIGRRFEAGGSGTLIATDGQHALVLTVAHVAEKVGSRVTCQWGSQKVTGHVAAVHPTADLALLLVNAPAGIKPVPIALPTADTDPLYLAGYPGYDRNTLRYQRGNFVDLDDEDLKVDCRPEKGMSGGPAYDKYGRVVGAVSSYEVAGPYGYCGSGKAMIELVQPYFKK
jgi:hypothetical protein